MISSYKRKRNRTISCDAIAISIRPKIFLQHGNLDITPSPLRSIEACEAVSLEDASPQWTEAVKGMETCQTPTAWPMRYSTWMGFWGSEDVGYCVFIFFACMHKLLFTNTITSITIN